MKPVKPGHAIPTIEEIVRTHQRSVWRFLVAIGCNHAEAEDIVQDTFITVLRGGFDYRGQRETRSFLFKVAKNKFITNARKRKRAPLVSNLDDVDAEWARFEEAQDSDDRVSALRKCIQLLTERSKMALNLRYRDGLDRESMARELQLKEAGVKTLLVRIRDKLRDCVERGASDAE